MTFDQKIALVVGFWSVASFVLGLIVGRFLHWQYREEVGGGDE